jgi:cob(I)alamin adenosyltransferase
MNVHNGDSGITYHGLKKTDQIIEFVGNVDELTAWINKCRIVVSEFRVTRILRDIENELMNIGKYLFDAYDYDLFRLRLDTYEQLFQNYTTDIFISMNSTIECDLNIARTVCRRCERSEYLTQHPDLYPVFNRISSILFKMILCIQQKIARHK